MTRRTTEDPYLRAVERNKEIIQWCRDNNIKEFHTMLHRMAEEKPEWFKETVRSKGSTDLLFRWFRGRQRESELPERRKLARNGQEPKRGLARPVRCIENGKEFSSINEAAKWLGHKRTHDISDCCYGIKSHVKGFHFEFIEEIQK